MTLQERSFAYRIYALSMRLLPRSFRERAGADMHASFAARMTEARSRRARARALLHEIAGVLRVAVLARMPDNPSGQVRPPVEPKRSGDWGRDMGLVIRRLARAPMFVATMAGTLAIGLGAFAVVATVVHKVMIAPLPYERPDDLYYVWRDYRAIFDLDRGWLGGTDVAELQNTGGVIEDAAALYRERSTLTVAAGVDPLEVDIMTTSPNLFELLGVRPELGRVFARDESGPGRAPLIVLTHGLWQQLGGSDAIVGSEVRLNDSPFTVIGVMPKSFGFVQNASLGAARRADAYTALDFNLAETNPGAGSYSGLIRVRDGTSPDVVRDAISAVGRTVDERDFESAGLLLYPTPLQADLVADVRPALMVVGLAGVFLVLVLMVNLATLLLTRAAQREKEFAVSRALGANRVDVVRATLLEGALLGMIGGAVGAGAAVWGARALVALAPADLPRREFIAMDLTIAVFVIGLGAMLGLLAATVPAVWAARANLASLLGNAAVRGGGGHGRMRRGMVVVQVALSLVLLSTGGLVVRSFERLLRSEPGFDAENVLTLRVPVSQQRYPETADAIALHDRMYAALAAIPGVTHVSASTALPLSASSSQTAIRIPGAPGNTGDEDRDAPLVDHMGVRAGYFETIGTRILAGREFEAGRRDDVLEAIIDRTLADHFFPNANALGATIPFGDNSLTVVGITDHVRLYDVHADGRPQLYVRAEDRGSYTLSWVLRSTRSPTALTSEVRAAVHSVDRQLALAEVLPMTALVGRSLSQQRVSAVMIGGFALGALLLAAMGLYGVISSTVTRRRHELAVRIALGADHGRVLRLVLGDGGRLILAGVLIGVPGTWLAGRAIRGALIGISATDPLTLIGVSMVLSLVALAACYIPARRVLGIEPASSLRNDSG